MTRKFLAKLNTKIGISAVVLFLVLFGGWLILGDEGDVVVAKVERKTIASIVDVTGSVVPISSADLGFENGGRVVSLPIKEGTRVFKGQLLAALDSSALYADLKSAQAALQIRRAEAENTADSVETIIAEQETLVKNAYKTLLSEGLEMVAIDDDETIDPPVISGRYEGEEGQYKVRIYRSAGGPTGIKVFGLEVVDEVIVYSSNRAVPLGTHGLFLTFEGDPVDYHGTDWIISIPNRSSSEYSSNLASYEEAVREKDRAIQEAREEASQNSNETSIANARVSQAEAEVARVSADISSRVISAPFSGLVKSIDIELGEIVASNATAMTIISDGAFQIEADLPEVDSTKVSAGMPAVVSIDAFGEDKTFAAKVISVDRAESLDGSVPVYKMTVFLDEPPVDLRSGMTANIVVEIASKDSVLTVPLAAVELATDGDFVTVVRNGKRERKPVNLGLRGDDGFVEIVGDVDEGDEVIIPQR